MWRFVLLCCISLPALASTPVCKNSAPASVLVELFTSQGCDSCPPAENWLAKIPAQFDSNKVISLAWHVDYWDYLGWKDEFSSSQFSSRQRERVRSSGSDKVYTPQLMINGLTQYWRETPENRIRKNLQQTASDDISITAQQQDANNWLLNISASTPPAGTALRAALIGESVSRKIGSGENAGRILKHPSPVLAFNARVNNSVTLKAAGGKAVRAVVWLESTQQAEVLAISSIDLLTCRSR